ncbi:hypothetical protein [Streptomyces microflavus]|uniref:hypothetical protein n=1 Tax=Streptomyces microflavus TaxID=1919 RepID=UPI0034526F33
MTSLLPTPSTSESTGAGHAAQGGMNLRHVVSLLPTPRASANENRQTKRTPSQNAGTHGKCLAAEVCELLPTPTATPYGNNQSNSPGAAVRPSLNSLAPALLPTPVVADSNSTANFRPDGTPYGKGYGQTLTDATRLLPRTGAGTARPSKGGKPPWDAPLPGQLTLWDD